MIFIMKHSYLSHLLRCFALLFVTCVPSMGQRFLTTSNLSGLGGRVSASVIYQSEVMKNQGLKGITINAPDCFTLEYDENKIIKKISCEQSNIEFKASEEPWTREDPNAFTLHSTVDGKLIRRTTTALVTLNKRPTFVMRSIYLGETTTSRNGQYLEHGSVNRNELYSPAKGESILTIGIETDGKFLATKRKTRKRFQEDNKAKIYREIFESRDDPDDEWATDSDTHYDFRNITGLITETLKITDPDGDALREEWIYYKQGEVGGPDGNKMIAARIKLHKEPDGTETAYQYLKNSSTVEIRAPGKPVRKTTYISENKGSLQTEVQEVNGVETKRIIEEFEPTRTMKLIRRPDGPDEVYVEEFYPSGKDFGGKKKRIIRPDGSITTYDYEMLSEGRMKLVEEDGKGDGEKVIEGTRETTIRANSGKLLESKTEEITIK